MRVGVLNTERWTMLHLVLAVLLATGGVLVMLEQWVDIYTFAVGNDEYSHIWLVPIVAVWMVWVRRARIRFCRPTATILGPILVGLGWASSMLGLYEGYQSLWHGGAVLVLMGCFISVLGKHLLTRFFPAMAVLIFLVPVPGLIRQQIALPLQAHTAAISQNVLQLMGMDAELSGNMLSINGINVTVAEACNGLRMAFPLLLVVYAFAFSMPLRNSVRLLILLCSPVAAIVCNVIRILPVTWLYGQGEAWKPLAENFHDYAGWVMLPLAFGLLYGIVKLLRWAMIPVIRYPLATQA